MSKPVETHMVSNKRLSKEEEAIKDARKYRCLIIKLPYLNNNRTDISFAVQQLSQFMERPTTQHTKGIHQSYDTVKARQDKGSSLNKTPLISYVLF